MAETTTAATKAASASEGTNTGGGKKLTVTWVKSAIGYNVRQKRTLKALGFTKLGQVVEHDDSPQMRGMLNAVKHLVDVKE
jgi:large subunit ribosomal protein L30